MVDLLFNCKFYEYTLYGKKYLLLTKDKKLNLSITGCRRIAHLKLTIIISNYLSL